MESRLFTIVVSIHTKPGCEARYLANLRTVLDAMRHEPTFVNTILNVDPQDPCRFMLYETWLDEEGFFSEQLKRPYRTHYEAQLAELLRTPREMTVWRPLRGDYAFHDTQ